MDEGLSRRTLIRNLLGATAAGVVLPPARASFSSQSGEGQLRGRERGELGRLAAGFKRMFSVPTLSIAIARNGQFVYDKAFGELDRAKALLADESTMFRIADVTKPITSVAIFQLIEKERLNLSDKVFGSSGILGTKYGKPPYGQYITEITVDHLLTHTCGGWPSDSTDPMFQHNSWDQTKLISWTLENLPLSFPPGQHWAYSNFGYCLLGRVIEQITGQPYAGSVQSSVFAPCGITDMQIGKNKEGERYPNEVIYYGQYNEDPYKINLTRMDSSAGWVATPSNLVQFLDHLGGFPNLPSLLKPETLRSMTKPCAAYPANSSAKYARGWLVDGNGNWSHSGSLSGSTTLIVRTSTGICWAALTNTRTEPHEEMDTALDELMWDMVRQVPAWGA